MRLILIRHMKSGWDDPMADDHARTLTERGHKAGERIGAWLRTHEYAPDVVLSSDAVRTRQTAYRVFPEREDVTYMPALYHASPDTLLEHASRYQGTVAVIAHNPGIAMAAQGSLAVRPAHARFSDYPTGATTVIDFDGAPAVGVGVCAGFVVPRDLG